MTNKEAIGVIDKCKHFLQILRKIYYKITEKITENKEYAGHRIMYLRDDGTVGFEFTPTGTDLEAERHWRAIWAGKVDLDGKFHNAGTDRWPDKQEERSKR